MSEKKRKGYADTFTEYASEFAGPSIKPSMTISSKRGELKSPPKVEFKLKKKKKKKNPNMKIDAKGDTLYNAGTFQKTNTLTGEKSKKEIFWAKKISKEEWDGPKIKIKKKKSGGHRKQVNK